MKTFNILFCIAALIACNTGGKKPANIANADSVQVLKTVELPGISTEEYVAGIINKRQSIEQQLPHLRPEAAAEQYIDLARYVDTALIVISNNEAKWIDEYVNFYTASGEVKLPANVQQRIELLATAGIETWYIGEGYTELRTVPTFYTKIFKSSLPADYSTYLQLKADEDTVLYNSDGGILVPVGNVGKRALNWENFIHTYPNSIFSTIALTTFRGYCYDYLFGDDNTPTFDDHEDLNSILPENLKEYNAFASQHANTETGKIVNTFLSNLHVAKTVVELRDLMLPIIKNAGVDGVTMLPVQADFRKEQVERLTKSVYDTVPTEIEIAEGTHEKIERTIDSLLYFEQNGHTYCVAVFQNRGKSGGAPVSGWVDVWAFKKTDAQWQVASKLLNAGGGGMYGNPGYFDMLIKMGDKITGIVVAGGITHMGTSASWDDLIAFKDDKLVPAFHMVTQDTYDGGSGMQKCNQTTWMFQRRGEQEAYDLIIIPTSCIGRTLPLRRVVVPYSDGEYKIPEEFQDTVI